MVILYRYLNYYKVRYTKLEIIFFFLIRFNRVRASALTHASFTNVNKGLNSHKQARTLKSAQGEVS